MVTFFLNVCTRSTCVTQINLRTRVRPFRFKKLSLISEMKRYWIYFACVSLVQFKITVFFCRFFSLPIFRFFVIASNFCCFATMRNKQNHAFFASKRKKTFSSISIFASEAKTRAHPHTYCADISSLCSTLCLWRSLFHFRKKGGKVFLGKRIIRGIQPHSPLIMIKLNYGFEAPSLRSVLRSEPYHCR